MTSLIEKLGTVAYLAPVFTPAVGGGVEYLELLSSNLLDEDVCEKFIIITEAFPGTPNNELRKDGRLLILRKYPFRAGRNDKRLSSYLLYAWQNFKFFGLPLLVRQLSVNALLVHGSFLNNPSTIWGVVRLVRLFSPQTKIIADLRDPKLSTWKIPSLKVFDLIISCSENITRRLGYDLKVFPKVREIPIIVDTVTPGRDEIARIQMRHGLEKRLYAFNGSGLSRGKGVDALLDLVAQIRKESNNDIALVVVGKRRYWSQRLEQAMQEGWFYYLGQVPHEEVLALAAGAWLDVNLSVVDSMPRHSLEAFHVGARVLFPKGIHELERVCPSFVASEEALEDLARKAIRLANADYCHDLYNVNCHRPKNVIRSYVNVLREID